MIIPDWILNGLSRMLPCRCELCGKLTFKRHIWKIDGVKKVTCMPCDETMRARAKSKQKKTHPSSHPSSNSL